ncbi:hypothetical protein Vi05172_g7424 [Venturia inaequalis]|nr:hypothetical protein Vi05172_g7424 [Venturia inaequalis]
MLDKANISKKIANDDNGEHGKYNAYEVRAIIKTNLANHARDQDEGKVQLRRPMASPIVPQRGA